MQQFNINKESVMKYLSQGMESNKKIKLLLSLTGIKENMQGAILDHLVGNFSIAQSAMLNGVLPNNLSVAIKELNRVAEIVEGINELKVYGLTHTNPRSIKLSQSVKPIEPIEPIGTQYELRGSYYKIGRHNIVFVFINDNWRSSTTSKAELINAANSRNNKE